MRLRLAVGLGVELGEVGEEAGDACVVEDAAEAVVGGEPGGGEVGPVGREDLREERPDDVAEDDRVTDLHHRRLEVHVEQDVLGLRARDLLGEAGFDPVYGARPLKRAIQQQIENPLAQQLLQGLYAPGDRIRVGIDEQGRLSFSKAV